MKNLSFILSGLLLAATSMPALADNTSLMGNEYNIKQFCETQSPRQTIVYVDAAIIDKNDQSWGKALFAKLRPSLMPSEPVSVVRLLADGRSEEVWKGCYPDYTAAQRAKINANGPYILQANPLDELSKQQTVFFSYLGGAFSKVLPQGTASVVSEAGDKKQIIRALISDEARYGSAKGSIRTIIYSDMVEKSDVATSVSPSDDAEKAAERFGFNLRDATVYVYGVSKNAPSDAVSIERSKAFWGAFFRHAHAHLASFGYELSMSNLVPLKTVDLAYKIEPTDSCSLPQDAPHGGQIHLFVNKDDGLEDSYITAGDIGGSIIHGTYACDSGKTCHLDGSLPDPVLWTNGTHKISLTSSGDDFVGAITLAESKTSCKITAKQRQ